MSDDKNHLVITNDDLTDVVAQPPPPPVGAGAQGGSYGGVGHTPAMGMSAQGGSNNFLSGLSTLPSSTLAGLIAAVVAWPLSEWGPFQSNTGSPTLHVAIWTGSFGLLFGAVYCAWDDITSGVWSRVPTSAGIGAGGGLLAGAASGAIAQQLYQAIMEPDWDYTSPKAYAARALGFAIFGLGIGAGAGAAKQSMRKAANGMIGGTIGGALGGLIFHFIAVKDLVSSEPILHVVSLSVIGIAIGFATGLVELARRQAWIRIVGGGMTGKEFIVYHEVTNVGSSPKSEVTLLKDPAVAPFHCRIVDQQNQRVLQAFDGCAVTINGAPISQQTLRNGDMLQIGGTLIQYAERVPVA